MIGGSPEELCASRIAPGDSVIFWNYRGDRPREIVRAFVMPEFFGHAKPSPDSGAEGVRPGREARPGRFVCMTRTRRSF